MVLQEPGYNAAKKNREALQNLGNFRLVNLSMQGSPTNLEQVH